MPSIIIIADDLTGANDSAIQFEQNNFSTIVKVWHDDIEDINTYDGFDVLSINTDTRFLSSEQAYGHIYAITKQLHSNYKSCFYKKIDSILRGNPGFELDAVMDATTSKLALVAPSFPANGRTVIQGNLSTINLHINALELFSKSMKRKVENIPLHLVRQGASKLANLIGQRQLSGIEVFLLDACTNDDLKIIKDTADLIKEPKILCGSAGLAMQLTSNVSRPIAKTYNLLSQDRIDGLIIVAIGSRSLETTHQLRKAANHYNLPIIQFETELILKGLGGLVIEKCLKATATEVQKGSRMVLLSVDTLFNNASMVANVANNDLVENEQALLVVETIGKTVRKIHDVYGLYAIISAGGDTSLQICKAFNSSFIKPIDEIKPGIPLGKILGGQADSMLIVTKSGGFGDEDVIVSIIQYLEENRKLLK